MRALSPLIDDLSPRADGQPRTGDVGPYRRPGWIWLGCIVFGIAVWTGVGFGIRAVIDVL